MSTDRITVHRARQHNLKGITVEFPRRALTVITGPSGSGKSSLAFDTLYAEGQRRYMESLSTYAKQFLERMPKPAVDRIDGISPAVAIEQKNPTTSSRSTVGTATEVYDYLRLLWARVGRQFCHRCGARVVVDSPTTAADRVLAEAGGQPAVIAFAPPVSESPSHDLLLENLRAMGFVRVMVGGAVYRLDELPPDARLDQPGLLVVVDRIPVHENNRTRICDSIAAAFAEGEGTTDILWETGRLRASQHPRCTSCGTPAPRLSPTLFSFNSPSGACPACNGFGAILEYDESLIVRHPERSLAQGALDPWTKPRYDGRRRLLKEVARREGIPFDVPWKKLKAAQQRLLLHGKSGRFVGIFPFLRALEEKRYKQYIRVFLRQYQLAIECPECHGARLRPESLAVRIADQTIAEVSSLTAEGLERWLTGLELTAFERGVADTILRELTARTTFLCDVGLKYLTLDRQTRSLSGGEAQRIALANALGSSLVDTLYVLDEPSIGLHPRDVGRLLDLLRRLRSAGNTVVMVEHDLAAMRASDYVIELGPGSGEHGGKVVYSGPLAGVAAAGTLTADYLNGKKRIAIPSGRRRAGPLWLSVKGAKLHNLRDVDAAFPLSTLTVVTGVSGSGKSTLVHDVLYRQLAARIKGKHGAKEHLGEPVGEVQGLTGWELLEDVVLVDQSPIGRSPRSNPVTYIKAFDEIRELYAQQPLSRARGYTPATFSFNAVDGGRCPVCEGAGHILVEMVFLADIFVPCEACGGSRFKREVLDVRIKGQSIADTLELTVDEAIRRFRHQDRLGKALWHLQQVGLGYLRLGQPATTLSGGEAQRLKIARQLATAGRGTGRRLYILDEPTTGLHLEDVRTLLKVLDRLVDAGHTVVVIEHHLDVIKRADWVIDLGPEGGDEGGRVVAAGTPEDVARLGFPYRALPHGRAVGRNGTGSDGISVNQRASALSAGISVHQRYLWLIFAPMRYPPLLLALALVASPLRAQQAGTATMSAVPGSYTLRPGDVLKVEVWGRQEYSGQFLIDETGHLQYPVIGDIEVRNLTVAELRERMRQGLEQIFKSPFVTVAPLFRMAVLGEVRNPGLYTVDPTLSVLDVVAMAGGASQSGNMNKIRLLRAGAETQLSFGQGRSLQDMGVRSGDQIIVGRKRLAREDIALLLSVVQVGLSVVILSRTH